MDRTEARIWVGLIKVLFGPRPPRPLTRQDKKREGLKYTRCPGYGFRWFRGRRVPDGRERAVMAHIFEARQAGCSWYQIAAQLLRDKIRTADGREWSVARVRRAYAAELRRREAGGEF